MREKRTKEIMYTKMIADKISDVKINRSLDVLKRIYIAQHIRDEGVRRFTFSEYSDEINILKKYSLIKENKWYSHELYLTTEEGTEIASQLVKESLQRFRNIIDIISKHKHKLNIPLTTLQFHIVRLKGYKNRES